MLLDSAASRNPMVGLFIILVIGVPSVIGDDLIQTSSGPVKGQTILTITNKKVEQFLGIPFAEPPIGDLRFKPPRAIKPWKDVFNATSHPKTCFQTRVPLGNYLPQLKLWTPFTSFSEDCLKLNIWVPKKDENCRNCPLLPVMILIHGGGFSRGSVSSRQYDGSLLASEQEVIVAMMNYRVASLGFMFLDHPDVLGNAGLYDQLLAIRWLKRNARAFGGDRENITLFGQSAGAASVGHHVLSPLSRGLFQRAIMESGSPTATWAFATKTDALQLSKQQVSDLGCRNYNMTEVVRCLRELDPGDLIAADPIKGVDYVYAHKPVSESHFLPGDPSDMLKSGHFNRVDLMLGVNRDEATFFMMMYDPLTFPIHREFNNATGLTRQRFVDAMVYNEWEPLTQQIVRLLYGDESNSLFQALKNSWGDYFIDCPTTQVDAAFAAIRQNVYRYLFAHRPMRSAWPKWAGVMHTDEMHYIFGGPLQNRSNMNHHEVKLAKQMMAFWGNFARTGNPNGKDTSSIYWPRYALETKEFLIVGPNSLWTDKAFREKFCLFWSELRPQLLSKIGSRKDLLNEFKNQV